MSDIDPLSVEQITFFKTHGYLILNDFIDKSTLKDWRRQIWTALASSPERPDIWPREIRAVNGFHYAPPEICLWSIPGSVVHHRADGWWLIRRRRGRPDHRLATTGYRMVATTRWSYRRIRPGRMEPLFDRCDNLSVRCGTPGRRFYVLAGQPLYGTSLFSSESRASRW